MIDMEHSAIDFSSLESLIAAAHAAGIPALVRPHGEDTGQIGKILDMGASGIMAPHVDTPERARAIVEQARFPPLGLRDAYRVQLANVERRKRQGERVVGHKVGLTARAMQALFGADEPDYGTCSTRCCTMPCASSTCAS